MSAYLIRSVFYMLFITFLSCEFDSDNENFKDIEKPQDVFVGIDLAGVNPNAPIFIYENTKLYFTLNTSGKKLLNLEATLHGEYVTMLTENCFLIFKESLKSGGDNILKLKIQLKTDSGSLADILNAEYYEGEFSFILQPVNNEFDLSIRDSQTNDKFLQLEWDKPSYYQLEIAGYEIAYTDTRGNKQNVALDASATSFVDKDFVGGYRAYSITMKFADEKISDKTSVYNMNYSMITSDDISIEFEDVVSTKISWKSNKYRCKYYILHNRNDLAIASALFNTPVAVLAAPTFPEESGFYTVVIVPEDMEIHEVSYSSGGVERFYEYKAPNIPLTQAVNAYDIADKLFYGIQGITVKISDASTLKDIKLFDSPFFEFLTSVSISPKSNKMLVFSGYNGSVNDENLIYIYDDKNDLNSTPKQIKGPVKNARYGKILLVDDNKIFIEKSHDSSDTNSYHSLIDANSGNTIGTLTLDMFRFIDVSYDRERLAFYDKDLKQLLVYAIKESGFELTHTIPVSSPVTGDLIYCTFNPKDSDQLIVHSFSEKRFLIIDVPSRQEIQMEGEFNTIDPFTERIYSYDKDFETNSLANIYEKGNYGMPAFQFKVAKYGHLVAYNDYVFCYSSYIQISKYFK